MEKKLPSKANQISRRTAIKTIAAGSAALMLTPNCMMSNSQKKKDKLGVALVGLGYYSTVLFSL